MIRRTLLLILLAFGGAAPGALPLRHFDTLSGKALGDGRNVTIDFTKVAKGTVVAFMSIHCPCSKSHETKLAALAKEFPDFHFYAIHSNSEETKADIEAHWKVAPHGFKQILIDNDQRLANLFGALKTPHIFVVDAMGNERYRGAVDNSRMASDATRDLLREALTQLQKGEKISQVESRPLGCAIGR